MASTQPDTPKAPDANADTRLQEAQARVKAASDRQAAIVAVVSRLGVTPAERRHAQSESKKVERELIDAKRALRDTQAAARTTKAQGAS